MSVAPLPQMLTRSSSASTEFEPRQRPLDFQMIRRILAYTRPHARKRNALLALVILRAIQLPSLTWLTAAIIKGPVETGDMRGVWIGAIAFALLALFTQFVMCFRQRWAYELGEAIVHDLRKDLFGKLQTLTMGYFNRAKLGRLISRMASDVESIRVGVQEVLFISVVQLIQMLIAAGMMAWQDLPMFCVVLLVVPALAKINSLFHERMSKALRDVQESFSRVTATLAESVLGIRVTQAFVRQERNSAMFEELARDHSKYNYAITKTQGLFLPMLDLGSQLLIGLLILVGGYRVLSPGVNMDVGDLICFLFLANLFLAPITVLGGQYNQAMTAMAGAERVFSLLDTQPDWKDPDTAEPIRLNGAVEFRDVGFAYQPGRPVLKQIHLTAKPGAMIALVGHTGSGKSTLVSLLSKFHLPTTGQLLIDGRDIREIQTSSLRRQSAVVLQNNFLFSGTVRDNIRLGRPSATDDEIVECVSQLGCLDMLANLSDGFDTPVGERGGRLSHGQRQVVCFARAMLADPKILVLDEATSSVDPTTESRIQQALIRLSRGRTSFVVAHRLSTIQAADQILVLEDGVIVERGVHADLLDRGGRYARLHQEFLRNTDKWVG